MNPQTTIKDLSKILGVSSQTIRNWEVFLDIPVKRDESGTRIYSEETINLFKKVNNHLQNGFKLKDLKPLINMDFEPSNYPQTNIIEIIKESMPEQEHNFNLAIVNKYESRITAMAKENSNLNRELGRLEGQLAKFNEILALKDNQIQEKNSQIEEYKVILDELEAASSHKWWQFWK